LATVSQELGLGKSISKLAAALRVP
jgi:hypothetical protein